MVNTIPEKMSQCFARGEIAADYVPEQTVCVSERRDSCCICQGGEWLKTGCVKNSLPGRQKRGFFKKVFRKVKKIGRLPHNHIRQLGSFFGRKHFAFAKLCKICFAYISCKYIHYLSYIFPVYGVGKAQTISAPRTESNRLSYFRPRL